VPDPIEWNQGGKRVKTNVRMKEQGLRLADSRLALGYDIRIYLLLPFDFSIALICGRRPEAIASFLSKVSLWLPVN